LKRKHALPRSTSWRDYEIIWIPQETTEADNDLQDDNAEVEQKKRKTGLQISCPVLIPAFKMA
jgi:hypothetical protein